MAAMTIVTPSNAGATAAFAATTPAGDTVKWGGGRLVVEFRNTTGSSITVAIAPIASTATVQGVGVVTVPTRSVAVAASADAVFEFSDADAAAYVDTSGLINIAYTTGNVGLLYRALKVA